MKNIKRAIRRVWNNKTTSSRDWNNKTTSPRDLYNAVLEEDWDTARALLKSNNAQSLVEYNDERTKNNPLHEVCTSETSSLDIIQLMLNASKIALIQQNNNGDNPLHNAFAFSSDEVVAALLEANLSKTALLQLNVYSETPLHRAVLCSSDKIILTLIEACPQATSVVNNFGNAPLHYAIEFNINCRNRINRSSNIICHLIAAHPSAAITDNNAGMTPLHMFFSKWNVQLRNRLQSTKGEEGFIEDIISQDYKGVVKIKIGEVYRTAILLLQAATNGTTEENIETPFRPLHSAITIQHCPWSIINLILKVDPRQAFHQDEEGNLPIHIATSVKSMFDGEFYLCWKCYHKFQNSPWYQHEKDYNMKYCQKCFQGEDFDEEEKENFNIMNSVDKIPAIIRNLVQLNPEVTKFPNHEGRLPLHIAIENGTTFEGSLEIIQEAAPKAVNTRDIKTQLYPFMLAAVKHHTQTNVLQKYTLSYDLLTENPFLVASGIPK